MNKNEELQKAVNILLNISDNWNIKDLVFYPKDLGSFDEVLVLLSSIRFKRGGIKWQ